MAQCPDCGRTAEPTSCDYCGWTAAPVLSRKCWACREEVKLGAPHSCTGSSPGTPNDFVLDLSKQIARDIAKARDEGIRDGFAAAGKGLEVAEIERLLGRVIEQIEQINELRVERRKHLDSLGKQAKELVELKACIETLSSALSRNKSHAQALCTLPPVVITDGGTFVQAESVTELARSIAVTSSVALQEYGP